jgi:hypothetical protein
MLPVSITYTWCANGIFKMPTTCLQTTKFSFKVKQRFGQSGAGDAQLSGQINLGRELLTGLVSPVLDEVEQTLTR